MSGTIGHVMYAVLGAKAAEQHKLPIAPLIGRHWASYLAGSYLGADVMTMPAAICVDTGRDIGYCAAKLEASPLTGGAVRPFLLDFEGEQFTPRQLHAMFYGRAHLTFGHNRDELDLTLPWDHLPDYTAAVVEDALELFGPGERPLAYVLGWMTHLIGDGLIKSIAPGVTLNLLDGKYTPRNRPIQDLITFHEIGRKELQFDWPAILTDLCETPVEPVQLHFMRVGSPRGRLGHDFPDGWLPERAQLLLAVLAENRRYLKIYHKYELDQLELRKTDAGWQCREELSKTTGGLSYARMVEAAEQANFRHALWQIGHAVANLFEEVVRLVPRLDAIAGTGVRPTWAELTEQWKPA